MKLKSHTKEQILNAYQNGEPVWELDTGNDGEDDTLIGFKEEVIFDILSYYEMDEMPKYWTITQITQIEA